LFSSLKNPPMTKCGKVYLVGAGPGDPGLLSLKGLECLKRADLILYDGLVNPLLLRHSSARAERTCRSQAADGRALKQEEINAQLVQAAHEGKTVVRLKGGDPYIFGRGSEEAAALVAANIPFEVVPGVTAATAAGEYAGLSLTHRDHASAVAFITGHEDPAKGETTVDYNLLAKFNGTLVFYMGLHRLESIVGSLLKAGKPGDTPACVISRATTPLQRTVAAPLSELAVAVKQAELKPPSLIVVGECVSQRETLAWFEHRPLFGKRIGITRPVAQAGPAIERAIGLGAQPVLTPTIEILPPENWQAVDETLEELDRFDWLVFTSANGVRGLLGRLWETGRDVRSVSRMQLAAIGPSTAEALNEFHLRADVVPESYRAEALAEKLAPAVGGQRVLWARANRGRDVLPRELSAAGADVREIVVYRNIDADSIAPAERELLEQGDVDWIGLSSPSIARAFKKLLSPEAEVMIGGTTKLASISPVTTAAAEQVGLPIAAEANDFTWNGIFEAILRAEGRESS